MVLDGDLYLVPFAVLKAQSSNDYLCERFSLITTPSLTSLRTSQKSRTRRHQTTAIAPASGGSAAQPAAANLSGQGSTNAGDSLANLEQPTSALVIGNPRMTSSVTEQWGWTDAPYADQEAQMVAEMLQTPSLLSGNQATKDAVLRQISQVCSFIFIPFSLSLNHWCIVFNFPHLLPNAFFILKASFKKNR